MNKKAMHRLIFWCVLLCLFLLTGCAGKLSESNYAVDQSANSIVLRYMHMGSPPTEDNGSYVMNVLPEKVHERFPHIHVRSDMLPDEQYIKSLIAQLASGEGPDFFEWWPRHQLKRLVEGGYIEDLTGHPILEQFDKTMLEAFTIDGKVYGIPKGLGIMGTWYNKTLLDQYGITEFPTDWPSFLKMCERLKQNGIVPIVMPDKDAWYIQFGIYQLAASVVYPGDPDFDHKLLANERTFTGEQWREVLEKYKLLYDNEYIIPGSLHINSTQAYSLFKEGRAAMMFDGNWIFDFLVGALSDDYEFGFAPLPGNEPGEPLYISAGPAGGTVINSKTKHKEEILNILSYQYEEGSPLNEKYKSNYKMFPQFAGDNTGIPVFDEISKMMTSQSTVYFSNQEWPVGVAEEMYFRFQDMIAGQGTVEEVAQAMENKLREQQRK